MRSKFKILCLVLAMATILAPMQTMQADTSAADNGSEVSEAAPLPDDVKTRLSNSVVLYVGSTQAMVNNSETQVDADSAEIKPVIKNGRTLVPVRFIAESLGADVGWDVKNSAVRISLDGKEVELIIGNTSMKVEGKAVGLDAPAEIIGNRTFVPLRKLVEVLGKKVFYDRGLIIISNTEDVFDKTSEKGLIDTVIAQVNNLPVVGSYEKLKELLSETALHQTRFGIDDNMSVINKTVTTSADSALRAPAPQAGQTAYSESTANGEINEDYSATNVQVQGVDEADVVKTDGQYIYQVNKNRIVVAKAYPAESMEIVSTVTFEDEKFKPAEIYVDNKYLVVIGSTYNYTPVVYSDNGEKTTENIQNQVRDTAKAVIYDISDKSDIKKLREFELEGSYISSRKIGSSLYMIADRQVNYYIMDENSTEITPCYRDTAVGDGFVKIDYPQIRYFPQMAEPDYMIIGGIDLNDMEEEARINTYLGAGRSVYASQQNLYVTVNNYTYNNVQVRPLLRPEKNTGNGAVSDTGTSSPPAVNSGAPAVETPANMPSILPEAGSSSTYVYKFSLNGSQITYINKGEVPGSVLNQFSMDEYNSYFRIATTTGEIWQNNSRNNIYVLDELLNVVGKIEDIAPGEKIYSARFMGERGYMVTFKKVDPLFVVDLKDPQKPGILGALKIPGYSDYLHPYDENHIIGFGKDTVENGSGAYYQGMKIAVFDVTDVSKPVEMFKENIGDRGTDSELLSNHKALLFSKDKNLLAFPVTVMEVKNKDNTDKESVFQYGQFVFQGVYVYNIDLVNGFTLKGKITHMSDDDYLKAGSYGYSEDKYVQRALYIGDTLYTLSNSAIKANAMQDLGEKKTLLIP